MFQTTFQDATFVGSGQRTAEEEQNERIRWMARRPLDSHQSNSNWWTEGPLGHRWTEGPPARLLRTMRTMRTNRLQLHAATIPQCPPIQSYLFGNVISSRFQKYLITSTSLELLSQLVVVNPNALPADLSSWLRSQNWRSPVRSGRKNTFRSPSTFATSNLFALASTPFCRGGNR